MQIAFAFPGLLNLSSLPGMGHGLDVSESLEATRIALAQGNVLRAYDIATAAIQRGEEAHQLRYLQVLSLARMGETEQAHSIYDQFLVHDAPHDVDLAALGARLVKDRAWAAQGDEALRLSKLASIRYEEVFDATGDSFPAINAATLSLLSAEPTRAANLAEAALSALDGTSAANYFAAVTAAEAHLILGRFDEAEGEVTSALGLPGCNLGARSSTARQFARLVEVLGKGQTIVDKLRPPPVLHYCGHMFEPDAGLERRLAAQIHTTLDRIGSVIAYGGLSCGSDILVAEAILARGGELNIVLPFAIEDYLERSVAVGGAEWSPRFERCLAAATEVEIASPTPVMEQDQQLAYASSLVLGYSLLRAEHLFTSAIQLSIWDGAPPTGIAGTAADVARWESLGGKTEAIDFTEERFKAPKPIGHSKPSSSRQKIRSMLFADFAAFSRIAEGDLPKFWSSILRQVAEVISRYDEFVSSRNTWGDGLFVVLNDEIAMANLALDLQNDVSLDELPSLGGTAGLRIGVHLGPIFEAIDPITKVTTYFGRAVNMTARIEPVAATGEIFVTRQFAAMVAMKCREQFRFSLVGRLPLAKSFGEATMYRLTRDSGASTSA